MKALTCTHLSLGHMLAGASPAVVARSSDALRESRRVGADVHTPVRSDMLRDSRRVGTDIHTHERGTYARRGKPPSWRGLRMRHESQGVKAFKCTHLNVKHTLAGASPAVVARSSDALRESRRVGADVHTHERGTYVRRGKPLLPSWRCPRTR